MVLLRKKCQKMNKPQVFKKIKGLPKFLNTSHKLKDTMELWRAKINYEHNATKELKTNLKNGKTWTVK